MLTLGATTRVYLAAGATDMRKGFEGLFATVTQTMRLDPMSGHLFVFCNRPRNRIKVLYWDGSGLWVCAKRLEAGRFAWPGNKEILESDGQLCLSQAQWTMLVDGIDLKGVKEKKWHRQRPELKKVDNLEK